jgi:hypothetical protein
MVTHEGKSQMSPDHSQDVAEASPLGGPKHAQDSPAQGRSVMPQSIPSSASSAKAPLKPSIDTQVELVSAIGSAHPSPHEETKVHSISGEASLGWYDKHLTAQPMAAPSALTMPGDPRVRQQPQALKLKDPNETESDDELMVVEPALSPPPVVRGAT